MQTGLLVKSPIMSAETMMIANLTLIRFDRILLSSIGIKHSHRLLSDERLTLALEGAYAPNPRQ